MNSPIGNPPDDMDQSRHPVEVLAEEFATRIRHGESPSIDEYVSRHPQWAAVIQQVFEPIEIVERISAQQSKANTAASFSIPNQLGDFRIVREIGRGGMGIVYEAIQLSLHRHVALKVINFHTADREKLQNRFRREAESAARLHHTNIVQVYGSGEDQGVHFYAMQLIHGAPLSDVIAWLRKPSTNNDRPTVRNIASDAGSKLLSSFPSTAIPPGPAESASRSDAELTTPTKPLSLSPLEQTSNNEALNDALNEEASPEQRMRLAKNLPAHYYRNAARMIADVANALGYAHRQRILHRDIKPANLILDRDGVIWVTDFGLARRLDSDAATQAGEVLGTIRYMAPEQISGGGDARMDIYSLGLCLLELVTLKSPFDAPQQRLLDPLKFSELPSPRKWNPSIPQDLCTILLKACATDSNERYATANDFESDLRRFLEDRPILARKASSWEHLKRWAKRNPALATMSSISAAMLLTLLAGLALWNRQQQKSLAEIEQLYQDVETNLEERTAALKKERQANQRAEANLQLATKAFDGIMENIAARGSHLFDYGEIADETIDFSGAMLTEADVQLLESLLLYFQQLGEQNQTDLSPQTAAAHKRVGDIQQRIAKLEEAEASYKTAIKLYQKLIESESKPSPHSTTSPHSKTSHEVLASANLSSKWLSQQVSTYIELLLVQSQQGKLWLAWESYHECRKLIEQHPTFAASQEGRFQKAKLLNCIGRMSSQQQFRPMRGERSPSPNNRETQNSPNRSRLMDFAGLPLAARLRKEAELNREAIDLLSTLSSEAPDKPAYRSALAHAYRDESRLALIRHEKDEAEQSLARAVELLNDLMKQFPDNPSYQYQLAETLWASTSRPPGRPPGPPSGPPSGPLTGPPSGGNDPNALTSREVDRLEQSLALCEQLLQTNSLESTYLSMKGAILSRLGQSGGLVGRSKAVEYLTESVRIYTNLADRFPDLPLYRAQRIEALLKLSRIEPNRAKSIEHFDQAMEEADKLGNSRLRNQIGPLIDRMRERRQNFESNRP